MKTQLFPALLLICVTMNGQTGLGIVRPSLLEITETVSSFDTKVKEAYTEIGSAFDAKVKEAYKDYQLPDSLAYDYLNSDEIEKSRNIAEQRWDKFIGLCRSYSYGKALDCYLEDFADFFVYLRFSADRYEFLSSILLPLMRECRGEEFARKRYIEDLSFEKSNEEFMIAINEEDGEGYVPEVYPDVVRDLGHALAADGRLDEALALAEDLLNPALRSGEYGAHAGARYIMGIFEKTGSAEDSDRFYEAIRQLVSRDKNLSDEDREYILNSCFNQLTGTEDTMDDNL